MQPYFLLALLGSTMVDAIAPRADAANCVSSYNGKFEVTVSKLTKRDVEKRDCSNPNALLLTLNNGNLKDGKGRTGYIASNFQWQFDSPPQAGALVTTGFSVCDGALGLKGSTTFWQCLSGNFYNLYDRNWAPQCQPVQLRILPCSGGPVGHSNLGSGAEGGSGGKGVNQAVTAIPDGQPQAPVSQGGDGQPQAPPVTQISDGQPQGPTGSPAPPVTQISDGQPQVPTGSPAPPVTQISDGQPQVPTGSPQPEVPTSQPQVPTGSPAPPVTQISDGQPQAPTGAPVVPSASPVVPSVPPVVPSGSPVVPPVGTGTGVSPPFAPTQPPISGSSKAVPGLAAAVVVALVGMVAL